ncbi:MAG: hypothetical protein AB2658_13315 [Candidatus Thiodiazotropha endolucinida]
MASIAMLVGGALVNALAFSGSNYLFSMLKSSGVDQERKRHDKAVEQLQAAQAEWSRKRTERIDFITEELRRQGHAVRTFKDVDDAMRLYAQVTGKNVSLADWAPSPCSPTVTNRVTTRKNARLPSSSWGWLLPALWPTNSPSSEVSFSFSFFLETYQAVDSNGRQ